jgi:hypothetical protein
MQLSRPYHLNLDPRPRELPLHTLPPHPLITQALLIIPSIMAAQAILQTIAALIMGQGNTVEATLKRGHQEA